MYRVRFQTSMSSACRTQVCMQADLFVQATAFLPEPGRSSGLWRQWCSIGALIITYSILFWGLLIFVKV